MASQADLPSPRLLTLVQAAAYLNLPIATVRKARIGQVRLGVYSRYDRVALDAWLDDQRGAKLDAGGSTADNNPEAAFDRFVQGFGHAAGRS